MVLVSTGGLIMGTQLVVKRPVLLKLTELLSMFMLRKNSKSALQHQSLAQCQGRGHLRQN